MKIQRSIRGPRSRCAGTVAAASPCPWRSPLATALPVAVALALAFAAASDAQVTLYRDAGFRGRAQTFGGPVADLGRTAIGNDRASAVDVAPGCTATLFRDVGFRGPAIEVRGAVDDLRRSVLGNDRVSSLDVRCRGEIDRDRHHRHGGSRRWESRDRGRWDGDRGDWTRDRRRGGGRAVVLYRDSGFRAPRLEVRGSIAELGRTPLGNDRLSSLGVPPGCSAILYEDSHFRGRSMVVDRDVADLRWTLLGNDRVSSIEVRCR